VILFFSAELTKRDRQTDWRDRERKREKIAFIISTYRYISIICIYITSEGHGLDCDLEIEKKKYVFKRWFYNTMTRRDNIIITSLRQ